MSDETVHESPVHGSVHGSKEERKEYRREWMKKKRAEEKLKKELGEDQVGKVSLASVEKESVVQTESRDSDVVTSGVEGSSELATERPDGMGHVYPDKSTPPLTTTDAKFEEKSPGYWIYGNEVKERKCWQCGKHYETRLELNKFCGPECKEKWLSDAFGKLKGVAK